jgi:hypothetical protein
MKLSPTEISSEFTSRFHQDPTRYAVRVPSYNTPGDLSEIDADEFLPQGDGDSDSAFASDVPLLTESMLPQDSAMIENHMNSEELTLASRLA